MNTTSTQRLGPVVINVAVMATCLFGAAGRLNWPNGWVLIALSCATSVAAEVVVWRNPGLGAERRNVRSGPKWDKALVALTVLFGPVATWVAAGLETRHHVLPVIPASAAGVAVIAALLGGALLVWSMEANPYFSAVVRIQQERGHRVVTRGPYRFVRHPGYAGMSLFMLATPLILQSRWAFVPAVMVVALTAVRTVLEDRLLRSELDGYAQYATTVTYRLVPLVW